MKCLFIIAALFSFSIATVYADEYRPAYLELQQISNEVYDMLWKVPARGTDKRLGLYVIFSEDIKIIKPVRASFVGSAFIERSTISRSGGLASAEITIKGLSAVSTDVLVRIHRLDGSTEVVRLTPAVPSFIVAAAPQVWDVAKTYLAFGIEHIWQGIDHLLFVACLIFIAGTWRRILITITGFTLAHSVTLTLATLEFVRLAVPPIEAMIALSIVFLAREIAHQRRDTLTWRYPIVVSATFGLLHGFGFASALSDIGLPQTEIPAALLAFNVGVEIGQIAFVTTVLAVVWFITLAIRRIEILQGAETLRSFDIKPIDWLRRIEKPIAYSVGSITMLWTLERVMVF